MLSQKHASLIFLFQMLTLTYSVHCKTSEITQSIAAGNVILSFNSTENNGCRYLTSLSLHYYDLTIINKHYHFMTCPDRFPVPARSAVKSNLTAWCCQNLSSRDFKCINSARTND